MLKVVGDELIYAYVVDNPAIVIPETIDAIRTLTGDRRKYGNLNAENKWKFRNKKNLLLMPDLLMVRHGQSTYNLENRFTGWLDVPLSDNGVEEAKYAAIKLKEYKFDAAYTSKLKRAIDTLRIIMNANEQSHISVIQSEALNERNYGDLQGLNKAVTAKKYGADQVFLWWRSYNEAPRGGESLKETAARVIPFFHSVICRDISEGLNVLIVAHGNTLRAIIKELDTLNDEEIVNLNIGTGKIYLYRFGPGLKIIFRTIL